MSDPADRRVILVFCLALVASTTFAAVTAGAGLWVLAVGGTLALGLLPWLLAFTGRPRLLDDALRGVPFAWRGDRAGIWAIAPVAGALGTLVVCALLGLPTLPALMASFGGAAGYTALLHRAERRHERLVLLDLTVLELRFKRVRRLSERRGGVRAPDRDLEVQVRAGREPGRADPADAAAGGD